MPSHVNANDCASSFTISSEFLNKGGIDFTKFPYVVISQLRVQIVSPFILKR